MYCEGCDRADEETCPKCRYWRTQKKVDDMSGFGKKFYTKFTNFLNNGGGYMIFGIGLIGIIFAIIGFHGQNEFNWWWFIFFEVPLYVFCCWALCAAIKIYKKTLDNNKNNKKL